MNEIATLIKNYNTFIEDLGQLNQDIYEVLINYNIEFMKELWAPRDNSYWSKKNKFASQYQNESEVFYVGYNLVDDCPYLLLERMYELKNCSTDSFQINDCFMHLEDSAITKIKDTNNIGTFECEWGKCIFAKVSLLEITSQDIVNTDIKAIIDYLFKRNSLSLKTIKLL